MVELTTVTGRAGIKGCVEAATSADNIPTYACIGAGLISGNVVAKELEKLYTDKVVEDGKVPNTMVQFGIRSVGRLLTSAGMCALSGSLEGKAQVATENAAIGSAGMIAVDLVKSYFPSDTVKNWADLQGVPTRRYVPTTVRAQPRPVALQRPAMESAALAAKPLMRTASLRV